VRLDPVNHQFPGGYSTPADFESSTWKRGFEADHGDGVLRMRRDYSSTISTSGLLVVDNHSSNGASKIQTLRSDESHRQR
jgi:hypothetical protein